MIQFAAPFKIDELQKWMYPNDNDKDANVYVAIKRLIARTKSNDKRPAISKIPHLYYLMVGEKCKWSMSCNQSPSTQHQNQWMTARWSS